MSQTHADTDSIGQDSPLFSLFGAPSRVKIIEAFVAEKGRDLSVSDIARLADLSRSTVYEHLDDLQELGVIEHTRDLQEGHSPRYQLNEENEIAEFCWKLEGTVLKRLLELDGHLDS